VNDKTTHQLISYVAPAAPATRRRATGDEPFLRPEIGFTPSWYRQHLDLDFGRRWHTDPAYRRETLLAMRGELRRSFPGTAIGGIDRPNEPLDLLTGTLGTCTVGGIYGLPIRYCPDQWPTCEPQYLDDDQVDRLEPPDLDANPFFNALLAQLDWIAEREGRIEGYINWQGVLNNAHRLRGERLFFDLVDAPGRCRHLFACVAETMIDAARRVHRRQGASGAEVSFFTVSNCLVNMISPRQYETLLLPLDQRIAEAFDCLGIHNCAWNANPYLKVYTRVPDVAYIDMGLESDLERARMLFPRARRALMYKPMDLADKSQASIRDDLARIAAEYGPCDIVLADIDAGVPDERVRAVADLCL
jgi:hypothetical protein